MKIYAESIQNYDMRIYACSLYRIYVRFYAERSKTPPGCGGLSNGTIPPTPESLELGIGGLGGWRLGIGDRGSGLKLKQTRRKGSENNY